MSFLPDALRHLGVDQISGAVTRLSFTETDAACRNWFAQRAAMIGLEVEVDQNGNQWAWWGATSPAGLTPSSALVLGSHLDSVPQGGLWDGPLGIVAAFDAVERVIAEGAKPSRPVAVVNFLEEEGGRFGLACLGSRLLTGAITAEHVLELVDTTGMTVRTAATSAGLDPELFGADPQRLAVIGEYVEVHIEQGHLPVQGTGTAGLAATDAPLGVLTEIWPHGRWRFDITGTPNHAGTTPLARRDDPVLTMADAIIAVRHHATELGVLGTVGKVQVIPGAVNAIAARAHVWIDVRGADPDVVQQLPVLVSAQIGVDAVQESWTPATRFDERLTDRLATLAESITARPTPYLPSGAGHDAGVLAEAGIPVGMLVVRNHEGVSHAAAEHADDIDAYLAVDSLVALLHGCLQ